jgi:hypothetical protein
MKKYTKPETCVVLAQLPPLLSDSNLDRLTNDLSQQGGVEEGGGTGYTPNSRGRGLWDDDDF